MNGLFEKDLRLILRRKMSVLFLFMILIIMGLSMDSLFLTGYGTAIFGFLTMGTVTCDEADNGFSFLFTLPVTRKQYVTEKFLFAGAGTLAGWLISLMVAAAMSFIRNRENGIFDQIPENAAVLMVMLAVIAISTSVQMKFGVEKSRIVLLISMGALFAAGMVVSKAAGTGTGRGYQTQSGGEPSDMVIFLMIAVASAVAVFIAYQWGVRIMKKKEF